MRRNILVLSIALIGLVLTACAANAQFQSGIDQAGILGTIRSKGKIVVGMSTEYRPFEYKTEKGEIVGFDVDIAKELAKALGVDLVIKEYKFEDLLSNVGGDIDIVISGMTRTLDRALVKNFTDPYFETGQAIILSEKNASVNDLKELNTSKKKIIIVSGTTSADIASAKFPSANIISAASELDALKTFVSGQADALLYDKPFVDSIACNYPKMKVFPQQLSYEIYAFAIPKGDTDFLHWLNYFIADLKISGKYKEIYDKWFKDVCKI